mmetsp:Transcript_28287/g.37761  ORF Transcript_28287/g.37761 Transcript_28287/m.37761 type:complete len:98 (+) Transcript_28287:344-637(+)|eukprot:CAMPEP_0185567142 /NCGR_PEP_ID=MMETSP0434-20130131/507_1 /TAXON_ID=626734 ORGANISM="Favella taraikaensis, Strain Fe Narragansett Bay" /NCGR_SAMPLE_ID=MMETSP0434 /ASSEMBLY_ACC=CAM_ASM_000379 /LENGTH=97 /DNA_ID=CAMNT_0028181295 /DNA_START=280 /DNA_END=573 /DNA_ORIENTATION=-
MKNSCVSLAKAQISMMIAFGLNTCVMALFARTEYASDKQWFRIRAFNYACVVFQIVTGLINIIEIISLLNMSETLPTPPPAEGEEAPAEDGAEAKEG